MVTLSRAQYDALLGMVDPQHALALKSLRSEIDKANEIRRYVLHVRWQDVGGKAPSRIEIGLGWPPQLTGRLELDRPISKDDIESYVGARAANPVSVHVTDDENGVVGWTELELFDFVAAAR